MFAFAIWIPAGLLFGPAYALFLDKVLDRQLGFLAGVVIVVYSGAALAFAIVLWLPAWAFARRLRRTRLGWQAPLMAAALVAPPLAVLCGDACFRVDGREAGFAWFAMGVAAIAASLHDWTSRAWIHHMPANAK